jgi:hypothetical protein
MLLDDNGWPLTFDGQTKTGAHSDLGFGKFIIIGVVC